MAAKLKPNIYVVEHLDPEMGPWSTLEYLAIAQESEDARVEFWLSSIPKEAVIPQDVRDARGLSIKQQRAEKLFDSNRRRVCLLDPAAAAELNPEDDEKFDIFLFGGILGQFSRVVGLNHTWETDPHERLGDDPPRGINCSWLAFVSKADTLSLIR